MVELWSTVKMISFAIDTTATTGYYRLLQILQQPYCSPTVGGPGFADVGSFTVQVGIFIPFFIHFSFIFHFILFPFFLKIETENEWKMNKKWIPNLAVAKMGIYKNSGSSVAAGLTLSWWADELSWSGAGAESDIWLYLSIAQGVAVSGSSWFLCPKIENWFFYSFLTVSWRPMPLWPLHVCQTSHGGSSTIACYPSAHQPWRRLVAAASTNIRHHWQPTTQCRSRHWQRVNNNTGITMWHSCHVLGV